MQITYEQAMRPGLLQAFAARRGSGYMMRSEKRGDAYRGSGRPPKRKRAGFGYIFLTLLISVLLWPVGMVMLWRRKVRLQAGTKLLISLLTLCLSVFLIVFALTVPVDSPQFTAFQDKANDWLDKAAADIAVAGDAAMKKGSETWNVMSDFSEAGSDYALVRTADAIDKGVALAGKARSAVEELFQRESTEPAATELPGDTEAPADTEAPMDTEAPTDTEVPTEVSADETTEAPGRETGEAAATEVPADASTEAPVAREGTTFDIRLPENAPDGESATALSAGALHADGSFTPGEEAPAEVSAAEAEETEAPATWELAAPDAAVPAGEDAQAPAETPVEAPEEAPVEIPEEAPVEAPVEEPEEAPAEAPVEETPVPMEETPAPAYGAFAVKPAGEAVVYFYESGSKGFHSFPTAHGMNGAPAHTLAEAFAAGKTPCQSCGMPNEGILSEEHVAWVDENNRFHTSDECAAFSGHWRLMSLADALAAGCEACDACGAAEYAEAIYPAPTPTPEPTVVNPTVPLKSAGEITVYYYDASKGYHAASSCVGMNNAPAHTLSEAVAAGKRACGNCNPVAAELIGLPMLWLDDAGLCHTSDACAAFSGSYRLIHRDDALAQGLPACPDCGAAEYLVPDTVLGGE